MYCFQSLQRFYCYSFAARHRENELKRGELPLRHREEDEGLSFTSSPLFPSAQRDRASGKGARMDPVRANGTAPADSTGGSGRRLRHLRRLRRRGGSSHLLGARGGSLTPSLLPRSHVSAGSEGGRGQRASHGAARREGGGAAWSGRGREAGRQAGREGSERARRQASSKPASQPPHCAQPPRTGRAALLRDHLTASPISGPPGRDGGGCPQRGECVRRGH